LAIPQISLENKKILQSLNLNIIESNIKSILAYYVTSYLALHAVTIVMWQNKPRGGQKDKVWGWAMLSNLAGK
jgi:hypothetical protein